MDGLGLALPGERLHHSLSHVLPLTEARETVGNCATDLGNGVTMNNRSYYYPHAGPITLLKKSNSHQRAIIVVTN